MAQHQQHMTINDDDDDDDDNDDKWCDDVIKTDTAGQKLDIFTFAVRSQNGGRFYYEHSKNAAYGNGVTDQYIDLSAYRRLSACCVTGCYVSHGSRIRQGRL